MTARISVFVCAALFAFAAILLSAPLITHAHGAGMTFTATTTDYFVDVDYSSPAIVTNDAGNFSFKLFKDPARTKPVNFTKVWARVVKDSDIPEGDTVFSGWIAKPDFGNTGMSISFFETGSYKLIVRYNDSDNQIVESAFPFTVLPGYDTPSFVFGKEFWTGIVCGAALGAGLLAVVVAIQRRL